MTTIGVISVKNSGDLCLFCNESHLVLQNYFEKLEKLSAAEEIQGDGPKKERTKLITPQVAKLEHAYKPGKVPVYC